MTEILMKQKGLMLVCLDCGCQKRVLPGEVPVGDCKLCYKEFGWVLLPDYFTGRYLEGETVLEDGDMVIVDMKEPLDSRNRIYEIRRGGLVWYSKEGVKK